RGLAGGLAAGVGGSRSRICADRRNMDEIIDARCLDRFGDGARALALDRVESLLAALGQNADEIDGGRGALQRGGQRLRIAQIGLDREDLSRLAERLQEKGEVGPAAGDPDAPAVLRQPINHMAPDEPRASENRDQLLRLPLRHRRVPVKPPSRAAPASSTRCSAATIRLWLYRFLRLKGMPPRSLTETDASP